MTKNTTLIPQLEQAVADGKISRTVGKILADLETEDQKVLVRQLDGRLQGLTEPEAKKIRRTILGLPSTGSFEKALGFDFKLQVSNVWKFPRLSDEWHTLLNGFRGGIHPHLVANLLYYFSEPGRPVLDPMAGSGVTGLIIDRYDYFNQVIPGVDGSGPRSCQLYDLLPARPEIIEHNIMERLPVADRQVGFTLVDPPYLNIPAGYYGDHPALLSKLEETAWFEAMSHIAGEVWRVTGPGGRVAVVSNDYLKGYSFIPVGHRLLPVFEQVGFEPAAVIMDVHNNYVHNGSAFIVANAKRFKYRLNALRQVLIFEKSSD